MTQVMHKELGHARIEVGVTLTLASRKILPL